MAGVGSQSVRDGLRDGGEVPSVGCVRYAAGSLQPAERFAQTLVADSQGAAELGVSGGAGLRQTRQDAPEQGPGTCLVSRARRCSDEAGEGAARCWTVRSRQSRVRAM